MKRYASFCLLAAILALASCGNSSTTGGSQASEDTGQTTAAGTTSEKASTGHGSEEMQAMNMQTVDPSSAGVTVEFASEPEAAQPARPVTLRYRLRDTQTGQVLTDLPINHERRMHLLARAKTSCSSSTCTPRAVAMKLLA